MVDQVYSNKVVGINGEVTAEQATQDRCLQVIYRDLQMNVFPVNGKNPPCVSWKPYETDRVTPEQLGEWWHRRFRREKDQSIWTLDAKDTLNWGLPTGHKPYSDSPAIVVVDTDDEEAETFVKEHCPETPVMQRTGGGGWHRIYRRPSKDAIDYIPIRKGTTIDGKTYGIDIRADHGYIMAPGSIHPRTGKIYTWIQEWSLDLLAQCPVYDPAWLPDEATDRAGSKRPSGNDVRAEVTSDLDHEDAIAATWLPPVDLRIEQAKKYLAACPGAKQGFGKGADNYAFAVAVNLLWGYALPAEDAVELMFDWGQNEDQLDKYEGHYPWKYSEIIHKISDAGLKSYTGIVGDRLDTGNNAALADLFGSTPTPTSTSGDAVVLPCSVADYLGVSPEALKAAKQPKEKKEKASVAEGLIALATERADLWHDRSGGWASVQVDGHRENRRVKSAAFREWLVGTWYDATSIVANDKAVRSALEIIEHRAKRGPQHNTHLRWARHGDRLYCDLGTPTWEAVEIDSQGWRVVARPPVMFRRTSQTAAMPRPVAGGSLDSLRPFVATTDDGWEMIRGFLLDAPKGYGPYFVLSITGEQGSAKSSTCRVVRRIIDPVTAGELSALPKDESDFGVSAQHECVLAFDNVSYLKAEMSDILCRASTGGGIKTRRLYTDDELTVLPICCPVVINGIPDLATANDLISRSLIVQQPVIPQEDRRDEKELDADFAEVWPQVFGALLDHLSRGIRDVGTVKLARLPRMADSAKWVTACLGNESFLSAHGANEDEAVTTGLDASPTARLLRMVLDAHNGKWEGTAEALLGQLKGHANVEGTNGGELPRTARALSGIVRRDAPSLRQGWGWTVEAVKSNGVRLIRLAEPTANG